jgi:hypothetical protein
MNKLDIFEILQPFHVSLVLTNPIRDIRPQIIALYLLRNLNQNFFMICLIKYFECSVC